MSKVATAKPGTTLRIGSEIFRFGDDGTREVTEAEAKLLARYDGPAKVKVKDAARAAEEPEPEEVEEAEPDAGSSATEPAESGGTQDG